jgi:hypothetical protein
MPSHEVVGDREAGEDGHERRPQAGEEREAGGARESLVGGIGGETVECGDADGCTTAATSRTPRTAAPPNRRTRRSCRGAEAADSTLPTRARDDIMVVGGAVTR